MKRSCRITALVTAALAGGCAANGTTGPDFGAAPAAAEVSTASPGTPPPKRATYAPTEDEKKLNCKKLTGMMQVKILQLRGHADRPKPSALAKTAHQTVNPVLGAGTAGSDPDSEFARERARLDAYNGLLAEKKCKTFNIESELQGTGTPSTTPTTPPAAAKPAKK